MFKGIWKKALIACVLGVLKYLYIEFSALIDIVSPNLLLFLIVGIIGIFTKGDAEEKIKSFFIIYVLSQIVFYIIFVIRVSAGFYYFG